MSKESKSASENIDDSTPGIDLNAVPTLSKEEEAQPSTSYKSVLLSFIKQLASATGDLSQLTCPAVMLSGYSVVEYSAHWCDHPDLLALTTKNESAEGNRWFWKHLLFWCYVEIVVMDSLLKYFYLIPRTCRTHGSCSSLVSVYLIWFICFSLYERWK